MHDFDRNPYEVDLPEHISVLPRHKKIPDITKKKLTRWEKFAKEKGIKKLKKRSRMVWDELS